MPDSKQITTEQNVAQVPEALRPLSDNARVTIRRGGTPDPQGECVLYWMQRAERGVDNHAVNLAVELANQLGLPLVVYFAGISNFPHANLRHYVFLNRGLQDVEADLRARNISFVLRNAPHESHEQMVRDVKAAIVIGDENPMRAPEQWRKDFVSKLQVPFWTVDADVVIPSKLIPNAQYGAYTIRPRLYRLLPEYLIPYENPHANHAWKRPKDFLADDVHKDMTAGWKDLDRSVAPVAAWVGGTHSGLARLQTFTTNLLNAYMDNRNQPQVDGTSMMSPYLHYGHVGSQTIALAVQAAANKHPRLKPAQESYFNELIVWRELAINFVRSTDEYDTAEAADPWAHTTIALHDKDEREHLYTLEQLDRAETYDELWNSAQIQMVEFGWMHNFMRMYWAKKIVEWTPNVHSAMKVCVHLNDKYFYDGRDPNGYSGIAWAVLGKFDRAWGERPIFGKRRYMSAASSGKKFNSRLYIEQMQALRQASGNTNAEAAPELHLT